MLKTGLTFMLQVQNKQCDSSYSFNLLLKVAIYFPENRFLVINHQAQPPKIKRDNKIIRDNEDNACSRLIELTRKIEGFFSILHRPWTLVQPGHQIPFSTCLNEGLLSPRLSLNGSTPLCQHFVRQQHISVWEMYYSYLSKLQKLRRFLDYMNIINFLSHYSSVLNWSLLATIWKMFFIWSLSFSQVWATCMVYYLGHFL